MSYPDVTTVTEPFSATVLAIDLDATPQVDQFLEVAATTGWCEVDADGIANNVPLGQSGPFVVLVGSEQILCAKAQGSQLFVYLDEDVTGRGFGETSVVAHPNGTAVSLYATSVQSVATGGAPSVQWVDLGLVNLVDAMMSGPLTLYDMPAGTFLSSVRFTDDPDTVFPDSLWSFIQSVGPLGVTGIVIGTEKSFGWYGFGAISSGPTAHDTAALQVSTNGYGPFAALDTGDADNLAMVLSAASVGPIQIGTGIGPHTQSDGVRVSAISDWITDTSYPSPSSNTNATPGVLQNCMITAPDAAIAAFVLADSVPSTPLTVVTGVNDTFTFTEDNGNWITQDYVVAAGVYTTVAECITAMAAAVGTVDSTPFSDVATPSDSSGSILLTMTDTGAIENGNTITEGANDVAGALGFSGNPDTFAGGVSKTIWLNAGASGTSGMSEPDFAANAGGSVTDGADIVWYDTGVVPATVGKVHVVAEIVTLVSP